MLINHILSHLGSFEIQGTFLPKVGKNWVGGGRTKNFYQAPLRPHFYQPAPNNPQQPVHVTPATTTMPFEGYSIAPLIYYSLQVFQRRCAGFSMARSFEKCIADCDAECMYEGQRYLDYGSDTSSDSDKDSDLSSDSD